ncbi:MAG TPA: choice-of-anchor tandem repeat GloVer-containing protein [Verrucomicrobiae bacterium]|nr:choice-of-anchor tandem repeat GloVer-containing protein [Verrucomicrobiae bacterium]
MKRFGTSKFLSGAVCLVALCLAAAGPAHAQYSVFYSFAGPPNDGAFPNGELTQDATGNFFGTTKQGGEGDSGTIFRLGQSGAVTILYSLANGDAGGLPEVGLLLDTQGNLFGTTTDGGGGWPTF